MSEQIEPGSASHAAQQRQRASQLAQALRGELQKALIGQNSVIDDVLTALFAGGHVLLEGVPGLAKTLLVETLGAVPRRRVRAHPVHPRPDARRHHRHRDLRPAAPAQFSSAQGPIFANILLADEINRAPPKTQAALLEAMQERQVTVGGDTLHARPTRSSSSPRRTRSSRKAPTRCPRPSSTASCSTSAWTTRRPTRS